MTSDQSKAPRRKKHVITGALLAAFVGAVVTTWLATRPSPAPSTINPIIPADVTRIETDDAIAERAGPSAWTISLKQGDANPWPASTAAVRAALRAASSLAGLGAEPAEPPAASTRLTLTETDGDGHTIDIVEGAIGGRQTVVLNGRAAVRARAELLAPLLAGPLAWREPLAFPEAGPELTRLLIQQPESETNEAAEIDLSKTGGRWLLTAPVLARASEEAVKNAIGRVAGVRVERFIDDPDDLAFANLGQPAFTITVETPGDARRVRFGAQADAEGLLRYAESEGTAFIADATLLRELRLDPAAYTERRASPVAPADVASISVEYQDGASARAERTLSGWTEAPFDPAAMLEALTANDIGMNVAFTAPRLVPLATVTLEDLAGDPLDIIPIGRSDAGTLHAETALPGADPVYYELPTLSPDALSQGQRSGQ